MTAPAIQLRLGRPPGPPPERTRSWVQTAAGIGLTALLLLMLVVGMQPGGAWLPGGRTLTPEAAEPERVTFVDVPPVTLPPPAEPLPTDPAAPAARQTPGTIAPATPAAPGTVSPARPVPDRRVVPVPGVDSTAAAGGTRRVPPRASGARLPDGITLPPPARAGAPAPPCRLGPCLGGTAAGVHTRPAPMTTAERDSALQAIERSVPVLAEEMKRRDERLAPASPPSDPGAIPQLKGTSVPVGLPGGGPSKEQRERDRKLHAENTAILARIKARQDSIARADSLERVRTRRPPK